MPDYITVLCVNEGNAVLSVLVANECFYSLTVRVKVANVHSVAVSLLCGPEQLAVVVDGRSAHEYLLFAVIIGICYHYIMVAAAVAGVIFVEVLYSSHVRKLPRDERRPDKL